ncbi:MAG: hypothetical protein AAGA46_13565 [Cyanobacteria bacterium P01_F01_bin.13]
MSRLPRHPSRVKPPLRGRPTMRHFRGDFATVASVRYPPKPGGSRPRTPGRVPLMPVPDQEFERPVSPSVPTSRRLPRHLAKIQPPLRGRVATQHFRGDFAPVASIRRPLSPSSSRSLPNGSETLTPANLSATTSYQQSETPIATSVAEPSLPSSTKTSLTEQSEDTPRIHPYRSWGRFIRSLDQSWKWIIFIVIVVGGLFLLSQLLSQ